MLVVIGIGSIPLSTNTEIMATTFPLYPGISSFCVAGRGYEGIS
jgi:hypothetical protein